MSGDTGWKAIWKINAAFLRAVAGFGFGWIFLQGAAIEGFELFLYFAAIFALVGVKHTIIALIEIVKLVLQGRKWAQYRSQGATPKADRIASEADLRARGLIK